MRTASPSRRRSIATAVTAAMTLVVLGLAGCATETPAPGADAPMTSANPATTTSAVGPPTSGGASNPTTPPGTGSQRSGVPLYWVGASRSGFALYREFRTVPDEGGPLGSAVAAMMRMGPLDPDYSTPWKPPTGVTVSQTADAITVDLTADAFSGTGVGSEVAELAVQQLVWTVTAAAAKQGAPARTVRVLIDGAPGDAWGVLSVGAPLTRSPMAHVQAHAWVTSPQEGDTLPAGPVRFTGFGTSFEANFTWTVTNSAGALLAKGSAMGGDGAGGFGEFTFAATLPAGQYVVEVSTDDPSGGSEGPGAAVDTKGFTVS